MRTSHKLTRLVLALMSLMALATSLFAQILNPGGTVITPPGNSATQAAILGRNFPTPQPPGFRGNFNNENASLGGLPAGALVDPPAQVQVSDQKPGSLLVYPYYTSNLVTGSNTWATITNTSPNFSVLVHIFFIEGANCTQADQFLCLTPNASIQLRASDFDPATPKGWILAVAVDENGKPAQRNVLIGNAFVSDGNYVGNYGAESFTAYSNAVTVGTATTAVALPLGPIGAAVPAPPPLAVQIDPACRFSTTFPFTSLNGFNANGYIPGLYDTDAGMTVAGLNFTGPPTFCSSRDSDLAGNLNGVGLDLRTFQLNGGGYDFVPNRFAVEVQSPVDVPGQMIITVGLSGDLNAAGTSGGLQVGTGTVVNGNESPFGSFVNFLTGRCQSMGTIDGVTPRVPRGMAALIPAGNVGTMSFNVTAGVGIIMTPRNNAKGTSGIRTLHKTNVNTAVSATTAANGFAVTAGGVTLRTNPAIRRFGVQLTIPVYLPPSCLPQIRDGVITNIPFGQ